MREKMAVWVVMGQEAVKARLRDPGSVESGEVWFAWGLEGVAGSERIQELGLISLTRRLSQFVCSSPHSLWAGELEQWLSVRPKSY